MSVILAECNKDEKLTNEYFIINPFTKEKLKLNSLWGTNNL